MSAPNAETAPSTTHRANAFGERLYSLNELREEIDRYEAMLRSVGKSRQTIATYTEMGERFLNWLDGRYTPYEKRSSPYGYAANGEIRSKYNPLRDHLTDRPEGCVRMTFRHIERVIGQPLPRSAYRYAHWWANDTTGNHVQAVAWLSANRKVSQLDLGNTTVGFIRTNRDYSPMRTRQFG